MIQEFAVISKNARPACVTSDKFVGNILAVEIDGSSMVVFRMQMWLDALKWSVLMRNRKRGIASVATR